MFAKDLLWVAKIIILFFSFRLNIILNICLAFSKSKLPVGSSAKIIFGSFISIRKQVVLHEWDSVLPDIQSIGDDDSEILDMVLKDELRLLYDEAMNRIIIKNLSHGLSVGRIEGYIGDLSLSTVSTSILEDGLSTVSYYTSDAADE